MRQFNQGLNTSYTRYSDHHISGVTRTNPIIIHMESSQVIVSDCKSRLAFRRHHRITPQGASPTDAVAAIGEHTPEKTLGISGRSLNADEQLWIRKMRSETPHE
ncbi:hypothetical protein BDW69DRAFT_161176 [Aspergillus filifer]